MRHRIKGRRLGRTAHHRQALFKNLVVNLITHRQIKTTEAKYKAVKGLIDKLVTRAKKKTVHSRRILMAFLNSKKAVNILVDEIAPQLKNRMSGFTRAIRVGHRRGDDALLVRVTFSQAETGKIVEKIRQPQEPKKDSLKKSAKKQITTPVPGPARPQTQTTKTTLQTRRTTHK